MKGILTGVVLALLIWLVWWLQPQRAASPVVDVPSVPQELRNRPTGRNLLAPGARTYLVAETNAAGVPQARPVSPVASGAQQMVPDAIPGEYVLRFASPSVRDAFESIARREGYRVLDRMSLGHALRIGVPAGRQLDELLAMAPQPVDRRPNLLVRIPPGAEPDPLEAPDTPYQGFGAGAAAWLGLDHVQSSGGAGVRVAILDTGIRDNMNGQRMDLVGDAVGLHGDAVAAIVRQMAPDAFLMDVQVMAADGTGDAFTLAKGIVEAVDRGADILNVSIGTRGHAPLLADAVRYAQERGALIVASAGNEGLMGVSYPAAYEAVISVGAVDAEERHLYFSNRGDRVDLVAPGIGIAVPGPEGASRYFHGTSASAPFVAGAAAILLGSKPQASGEELAERLIATANDTGAPGRDDETGAGVLSPVRMLEHDQPGITDMAMLRPYIRTSEEGTAHTVEVAAQNRGTTTLAELDMRLRMDGKEQRVSFEDVGPGMTVVYTLDAAAHLASGQPLDVQVELVVPNDVRPDDNALRAVLLGGGARSQ